MTAKRKIRLRAYVNDVGRVHFHIDHVLQSKLRGLLEWKPSYKGFKSAQVEMIVPVASKKVTP